MLRTSPTHIPQEWLVRPQFSLWPPQRHSDIVATSTLRDTQYEKKTLPKPKRLDGLFKEVTVEGISEARKARKVTNFLS